MTTTADPFFTLETARVADRHQHRSVCGVCGEKGPWRLSASEVRDSAECHVATAHPETGAVWS